MKKTKSKILLAFMAICTCLFMSMDSFGSGSDSSMACVDSSKWNTGLELSTRNVFRGVGYGESPSAKIQISYDVCPGLEVGTYGYTTLNGTKEGYGKQVNLYAKINLFNDNKYLKGLSVTLDDYYYFGPNDLDNDYSDWSQENTQHWIEGRVKYDRRLDLMASYVLYKGDWDETDAMYFEAGYALTPKTEVFVGYLTGESNLMFQTEGGFTNMGVTVSQPLNRYKCGSHTPTLKGSVIIAPTYKTIADIPGVGRNYITLVGAIAF